MMGERMMNALMCQMLYQVTDYTGCILGNNSYSGVTKRLFWGDQRDGEYLTHAPKKKKNPVR